ncbi:MAG: YeeE/YedE thiosulfate transporter family protein [Niameybacter sp.]|uniref:YeeE/YedE thiosulfate transporter family protein n=1 Tax=Niameybacter sp. TaxID=2033640 RepID=UPI002FC859B7
MENSNWLKNALVLGIVFFLAIFIVKPIGVSTQFSVLSGILHSMVDPGMITTDATRESGYQSSNAYYDKNEGKLAKQIKDPWNYDLAFVLGMPLGGTLVYLLNRKKKPSYLSNVGQAPRLYQDKQGFLRLYLPSFVGGFLILFGARMADGCTSGHMMSGMMQGSVSGYIFAGAVFVVAIPTALLVQIYSKRKAGR